MISHVLELQVFDTFDCLFDIDFNVRQEFKDEMLTYIIFQ